MRSTMLLSAALALVLGAASPAPMVAEETSNAELKTVLTVSISGYDSVMEAVDALAKAGGVAEMTMLPKMLLGGPAGPGGLDGSKPIGLVVQTDGTQFPMMAFVPITDADEFLKFLERFAPDIPEPDSDGVYEVNTGGQTVFIQQKDGWAFVVIDRAVLENTPTNPASLLDGMEEEYALAVRAQVDNIPKELRADAMQMMQMAALSGSNRNDGESDAEYEIRQKMTQQSIEGIQTLVNEMNTFTIGLAVDATDGTINLEGAITAVEGTSLAGDMADFAGLTSGFSGFFSPHAALTVRATGKLSDTDVTQMLQMIEIAATQAEEAIDSQGLSDADKEQALALGEELLSVVKQTINGRLFDGGMSLVVRDGSIAIIAGGHVAAAGQLDEIFKKVVDRAKEEEPDVDQFLEMNVAQHKGVTFHTLTVPAALVFEDGVPPAYADKDVKVSIGFGESAVYAAHGPDPVGLLKAAIDRSAAAADTKVIPAQVSLSARAIGSLMEVLGASEEIDIPSEIIELFKQAGEKDHLIISSEAIPNGMKSRITIEGGVLSVIGAAAKAAGGGGQPGGF